MTVTLISSEDYLRNEITEGNSQQTDNTLYGVKGKFAKINNDEQMKKKTRNGEERYRPKGYIACRKYGCRA